MAGAKNFEAKSEVSLQEELAALWHGLPHRGVFLALLLAWVALFHFLGNSVLGYVKTESMFGWLWYVYTTAPDEEFGKWIPLVVLVLLVWKRHELMALPKRIWWPALGLVALGLLGHAGGYVLQQTRISIVGFVWGLYGLTGLLWGWHWLKATFFPVLLFAFCVPMSSVLGEHSFPLRMLATSIATWFSHTILGIPVLQNGTMMFDANGGYRYDVDVACGGLRSLTAMIAMNTVFAFVMFKSAWRRGVLLAAAVPLAVLGNVFRLTAIIFAAETFGHAAGSYVHDSPVLSLLPYV
ncbi:MAG TPA: exosortase/archaeosortase family protein, partial [Verrucomicrobiae bacterium]